MKRSTNRAHYGALSHVGTEEYKRLTEENRVARISNTLSVEIDSSSWSQFASNLFHDTNLCRCRSAIPAVPSQLSCTVETDIKQRYV